MAEIFLQVPARVLHGAHESNRLGIEISRLGKRVLLISEPGLKDAVRKIQKMLEGHGIGTILFDEEPSRGTSFTVENCQNLIRGSHAESVLAYGGGRTICIARAVASSVSEGLHPDTLMESGMAGALSLPCIELISEYWIPFFLQPSFCMTNSRDGISRIVNYIPNNKSLQVCDPVLTLTLPERQRTPLFFELLLSTLVCSTFPGRSFLSEVHCLSSFRRLWKRRKDLLARWDLDCAGDLMEAGFLTAMAHKEAGIYWTTLLTQALSGHFQPSRSIVSMILLPFIMDYLVETATSEIDAFLASLSDIEDLPESPEALADSVRELVGWYSMPSQLRSTGIPQDALAVAAESAGTMLSQLGLGGITVDQMYGILKNSW